MYQRGFYPTCHCAISLPPHSTIPLCQNQLLSFLYPHHSTLSPSLVWIPFHCGVMGLLVWLMHCDLLGLAVYLFPSTERERKKVECFLKGKQKREWAIKGSALKEGRKPVFRNKLTVKNEVNEDKLTEIVHHFAKSSKKENRSCECRVPVQLRARSRLLYSTAAERRPKQPGIVKIDGCRVYPDWGRQSQLWNQTCSLQINVSAPNSATETCNQFVV